MKHLLEFKDFRLMEGGNAFPETVSVKREDIEKIISQFNLEVIQGIIGGEPAELIGSWKQKPISGDIDCLLYTEFTLPELVEKLKANGIEAKAFYGFNIVSAKFLPGGHPPVQIDIFVRPSGSSKDTTDIFYKNIAGDPNTTKHRVYFLFTMLDFRRDEITGPEEMPTSYTGFMLRPDGLYKIRKALAKTKYKIVDRQLIAETPEEISEFLFGKSLPFNQWDTFEKTLSLFKKSPLYSNKNRVIEEYITKLSDEGLPLPVGLD